MKKLGLSLSFLLCLLVSNYVTAQTWSINGNSIINTPSTAIARTDANSNINNLIMLYNGQEAMAISQINVNRKHRL
jgi:hypothetical protein